MFLPRRPAYPARHGDHAFGREFGVLIGKRYGEIVHAAGEIIARRGFHQATTREIAKAAGLSLAGLYHYVGGKGEILFLVLDRGLDRLLERLDRALAAAPTPELQLRALVQTHLDFAFTDHAALKVINRDWELLDEPRRREVSVKRAEYLRRGITLLQRLDPQGRPPDELFSATNLLLGMLNGIGRRPFLRAPGDSATLAAEVTTLFLHGFLESRREPALAPLGKETSS